MSGKVRFISDLHFGHEDMAAKRGFLNANEMNDYIIKSFNSVVNKRSTTYILGDISMERSSFYPLLSKLNGHINIVLGNHDRRQDVEKLLPFVNSVAGTIVYKKQLLTHIPVHESALKYESYTINIHGHVHENTIGSYEWSHFYKQEVFRPNPKYYNVSCEAVDYIPRTLEELKNLNKI